MPEQRDGFIVFPNLNVPRSDSGELLLHLKGEPSALMAVETVMDGERVHPLSYSAVPDDWEAGSIPISGDTLNQIPVGIGARELVWVPDEYRLFIDWIAFQ